MLDVSIVNVALPSMRSDLHFTTAGLPWVLSAYTLTAAGFLLLGGRLGDLLGRREVFTAGLGLFAAASVVGGLAQHPQTLIAARALQGLGAAVVAPASLSILSTTRPEGAERNRAFGLWGVMGGLGGASGALAGGVLTAALSWRAVLLVNTPMCAAIAVIAVRVVPRNPSTAPAGPSLRTAATATVTTAARTVARTAAEARAGWLASARRLDVAGALSVTAALVLIVYGVTAIQQHGWVSPITWGPIAAGLGLLALFVLIEGRLAPTPLVPLGVFTSRAVSGAGAVVFCLGATVVSMWYLATLYLQQVLGYSPVRTGLAFAPISLTIMVATGVASRVAARLGAGQVLAAGTGMLGAGMLAFSRIDAHGSWAADVLGPSLVCGFGIGCSFVSATIAANTGVRADQAGLVSGVVNTANQVGASVGLAALATIAAHHTAATLPDGASQAVALTDGFRAAFLTAATIALTGCAITLAVLVRHHPSTAAAGGRRRPLRHPDTSTHTPGPQDP